MEARRRGPGPHGYAPAQPTTHLDGRHLVCLIQQPSLHLLPSHKAGRLDCRRQLLHQPRVQRQPHKLVFELCG